MNNLWAFLPMRDANDLLGDPDALRARLDEDSYLLFRGLLDPERVTEVRRKILGVLARRDWVEGGVLTMRALAKGTPVSEADEEYRRTYDAVQRIEAFHTLAHDECLLDAMRQVVGDTAFPHPLKIARLSFPGHYEVSTPPHQDYPNNQGTPSLTAAWVPVGDISHDLGGLAVLRGSHRYGLLPLETHPGAGNRQAHLPLEMREQLHWVTTEYQVGDVLVFPSLTVHASLSNVTEFNMRISVDFRYQQEGEALTPIVLEPHFQRQSWEQVYAGWESDRYQYYWKDLDYEVVPFEDFDVRLGNLGDERPMLASRRYERRRDARSARRRAAIAAIVDEQARAGGEGDR